MSETGTERRGSIQVATAVVALGQLGLAGYVWFAGPADPVPVHFGLDGEPNRWASRGANALWIGFFAALTLFNFGIFHAVSRLSGLDAAVRKTLWWTEATTLGVFALSAVLLGTLSLGIRDPISDADLFMRMLTVLVSVGYVATGVFAGKAKPSSSPYAARMRWTDESRLAFDKSNRLLGRVMFVGGLALIAASFFIPGLLLIAGVIVVPVAAAALAIFEARRVWLSDPERIGQESGR